ncbi:MAG: response regulator [Lachnospiraceae bacterium]|nr:response regulator [Lachnospiraceae bacterium]
MEKKVLLLGDSSSFMVGAIKNNLIAAEYEVVLAVPNVDVINMIKDKPSVIILYLGDYITEMTEVLVYLKDICLEDARSLYLVGKPDEFEAAEREIPEGVVSGKFERPLNVKDIVETLDQEFSKPKDDEERKKHILVVDDSGTMLRTIKSWLGNRYKVSMVNSGMNAITFLANYKPDLILLDYEMPICTGPQVLKMIRSEVSTSSIPVIFFTARGDKESVMEVLKLKPEGYLLKSMKPSEIMAAINNFFENEK